MKLQVNDWVTHIKFGWSGQFKERLGQEDGSGRVTVLCVVIDEKGNIFLGKEENLCPMDVSLCVII